MLTIRTKLIQLPVKGISVIADEDIKDGQVVYINDPDFTKFFSNDAFEALDNIHKDFVKKHATQYPEGYWLDTDDTRFLNHSLEPNIRFTGKEHDQAIATRSINKGEEITVNYLELNPNQDVDYPKLLKLEYIGEARSVPYQCCPKCGGQGTVSKPPYVAGDVHQWTSSATSFPCDVCHGAKIIPQAVIN